MMHHEIYHVNKNESEQAIGDGSITLEPSLILGCELWSEIVCRTIECV